MEMMKTPKLTTKERQAVSHAVAMLKTDLYFITYYEIYSDDLGAMEAWQLLENDLQQLCGVSRYSDYNSFKEMRRRYVKRLAADETKRHRRK